jgi:biopolymer transport protein ExbD
MRLKQRTPGRGPEENLIPLINIVFLILIFFLVASTLRSFDPSGLDLTSAQADADSNQGANVLLVFSDGGLALAGKTVAADALEIRLTAFAKAEPDLPLLIAPDRALPAKRLVEIANAAKSAGVEQVKLIVRKPTSRGAADP